MRRDTVVGAGELDALVLHRARDVNGKVDERESASRRKTGSRTCSRWSELRLPAIHPGFLPSSVRLVTTLTSMMLT
jgi:hypothetical protein